MTIGAVEKMTEAQSHTKDLYVVDEEFNARGGELVGHRDFFSEIISEYVAIADYLCTNIEGETANAIRGIADSLRDMPGQIVAAGESYQGDCEQFVAQIDAADSFLYGG
jgi:hypothetical protein